MKANLVDDLLAYDPAVHTEMGKGVERTYGLPCAAPRRSLEWPVCGDVLARWR